jgi:RHS repeat-associated protein
MKSRDRFSSAQGGKGVLRQVLQPAPRLSVAAVTLFTFVTGTVAPSFAWAQADSGGRTAASSIGAADRSSLVATRSAPGSAEPAAATAVSAAASAGAGDAASQAAQAAADLPKGGAEISPQAISLPGAPASVGGMGDSFTAQLSTGIAAYNVPFSVPKARGDQQVGLGLVYSSSAGYGLAGVGWSLAGQLAIARQTDRGIPVYDDRSDWHPGQDRFVFGGDELVPICLVAGALCAGAQAGEVMPAWASGWQYFRSRIEGKYLRYFWSPDHRTWRVQGKDGMHLELGVPLDLPGYELGLERNPDRPSEIFQWHLVRQYDSHGNPDVVGTPLPTNPIVYRYFQDAGRAYLSDVFYVTPVASPTTSDLASFAHHVRMAYELRSDQSTSYRAGWSQAARLRLARVDVASKSFTGATNTARVLTRRYHLAYEAGQHVSILASVQAEGRCSTAVAEAADGSIGATACPRLPPLKFGYTRVAAEGAAPLDAEGFAFEPFAETLQAMAGSPGHSLGESQTSLMDVNSDGLPDVIVTASGLYRGKHAVFFNSTKQLGSFEAVSHVPVMPVGDVGAGSLTLGNANVSVLDLDGDGVVNFLHQADPKTITSFAPRFDAEGWKWVGRKLNVPGGQSHKIDFTRDARRSAVMDVNGDGLVDVVVATATEMQTYFALGRYPGGDGLFGQAHWSGRGTAELSSAAVPSCVPWSGSAALLGNSDVHIADVNGDGFSDIVRLRSGQVIYWPGRGNGTWGIGSRDDCAAGRQGADRHIEVSNAPRFGVVAGGSLQLGDVNGDGFADVVEFRRGAVDVYLNSNGRAFADRHTLSNVPDVTAGSQPAVLTDINGSGTTDLLWGTGHDYRFIDLAGGVRPYLLTSIDNGLGKLSELSYETSAQAMAAAAARGEPWTSSVPLNLSLVARSVVRDNLSKVGRSDGVYVTEYRYRDPVFDGRQREFRGFRSAEERRLGDVEAPTSISRSVFLLGECVVAQNGNDVCAVADRWKDNWREALKGLLLRQELLSETGVYSSSRQSGFELRQLYTGRDERAVIVANQVSDEGLQYDTAPFTPSLATDSVNVTAVSVNVNGITQTETVPMPRRAVLGTVTTRNARVVDAFGNTTQTISSGCVSCTPADEVITVVGAHARPANDDSGWNYRLASGYTYGSAHTARRREVAYQYDKAGDLERSTVVLSGSLALVRSHAVAGAVVAAQPPDASLGITAPVTIETATYVRDVFGNETSMRGASNRCRTMGMDARYAELPIRDGVWSGTKGPSGCGTRELVTSATYDRGLGLVVSSTSASGQASAFVFDGLGRLLTTRLADPAGTGALATRVTTAYTYTVPADAAVQPYSIIRAQEQDGANPNTSAYRDEYTFVDGLGRTLATLTEADTTAGDGGTFVVSSVNGYSANGTPVRTYKSSFWSGTATTYPLTISPSWLYTRKVLDAFNRPVSSYGFDGQVSSFVQYHPLSVDLWDAADIVAGPQQGTFMTVEHDGHGRGRRTTERLKIGATLEERHTLTQRLPTGEVEQIIQRRAGSADVVRWMRYDSLGRLVLNVEPNTSPNFTANINIVASSVKAIRYAYNDGGDLVGTSDARGCGSNKYFDTAGRITAVDLSPCAAHHAPYSAPDFATNSGIEIQYNYDLPDDDAASIVDSAGVALAPTASLYWGRLVSIADLGSRSVLRYDGLGRVTGAAVRLVKPGVPDSSIANRFAPRWYLKTMSLDAAGRTVELTTGATTPELMGADGRSAIRFAYSRRGAPSNVGGSYGTIVKSQKLSADAKPMEVVLGDAASTKSTFEYDLLGRVSSVQTFRAIPALWSSAGYPVPTAGSENTQQLLLQDHDIVYDAVGNIVQIVDFRSASEWPNQAKPVTRGFEYDGLNRLTRVTHGYAGGQSWQSPFAAENAEATGRKPAPHVSFSDRLSEQRFEYDHLGNMTKTTDDASGFYDRSLGVVSNGSATAGPNRLTSATNRGIAASSIRKGDLAAGYDASGNLTGMVVKRDGPCLPAAASCWQRFLYQWDEQGQLSAAKRWDLTGTERTANATVASTLPARPADADLRYSYDAGGDRVRKTAVDAAGNESHDLTIFPTLELRKSWWTTLAGVTDYVMNVDTTQVSFGAGGIRGRIVRSNTALPSPGGAKPRVLLQIPDHLGSTSAVIDHETGELVEYATYQAYGATESDYRPLRWGSYREPYKFSGKEEDVEVGLAYFGSRYLVLGLARWASPDPVTIHQFGSDKNPYAYVAGRPLVAVDPDGRELITAILIGAAIGAAIAASANATAQIARNGGTRNFDWGSFGASALVGAAAGALMGATISMGGVAAAKFIFAYSNAGHAALGWAAVAGFTMPIGAVIGTTVAGATGAGWKRTWELAGAGTEAGFLVAAGGALAHGTAALAGMQTGFMMATSAMGAINGAFTGARGTYEWRSPTGYAAFASDSTWGIFGTSLGNIINIGNTISGANYSHDLSHRQNRQVFLEGFAPKDKFAHTQGNVISNLNRHKGAHEQGLADHEAMHIMQNRLAGPFFQGSYAVFAVAAGLVTLGYVGVNAMAGHKINLGEALEQTAYRNNPWERMAYDTHNPDEPTVPELEWDTWPF